MADEMDEIELQWLEEEVQRQLAEEIRMEIDNGIIKRLFIEEKFPYVFDLEKLRRVFGSEEWIDIAQWTVENIGAVDEEWTFIQQEMFFKNEKDMALFILKWTK